MNRIKRGIFFWVPPLLWMGLIYFLSSFHKLQASTVSWQDFVIRKAAHFTEYFVLFTLLNCGLKNTTKLTPGKRLASALLLTILYAVSDEFHQTFVSGRTGKSFDIGIDSLGGILGLLFSWKLVNLLPKELQKYI